MINRERGMETENFIQNNQLKKREDNISMILPNNIKKYVGHLREFDNRYIFEYVSREKKIKESFYFSDLGNKENAYNAALLFQRKWCQNNNLITNIYYIINNEYVIVELNNDKKMKIDLEDINLIENYNWRIQNNSIYPSTFQLDESGKRNFVLFYRMKFNTNKIHFKNNDKLDYRNNNIILI